MKTFGSEGCRRKVLNAYVCVSVTNIISKKSDVNGSNSESPFLEIDEEEYYPIPKAPTLSVHKRGLEAF